MVLLDHKVPEVSGREVLKTMKSDEGFKTIPMVVLTSSRETPDLLEFHQHGINEPPPQVGGDTIRSRWGDLQFAAKVLEYPEQSAWRVRPRSATFSS